MAPRTLTVASAQLSGCGGSSPDRLARVEEVANEAGKRGASLVVFPEMSLTGYELRRGIPSVSVPGAVTDALTEIARRADLFVVAGLTEAVDGHKHNTLVLVGPDGYVGGYRKLHVSAVENAFWRCGRDARVVASDLGRIGFGICADMLFPTPWRAYAGQVDLVVIGAAWPDHRHTVPFPYGPRFSEIHEAATAAVPTHLSRALGVPVVLANACGRFEARLPPFGMALRGRFAGRSCIVDGEVVARADTDETLLVGTVGTTRRAPQGALEPWMPEWPTAFRVAAQSGDVALGVVYRAFYRAG